VKIGEHQSEDQSASSDKTFDACCPLRLSIQLQSVMAVYHMHDFSQIAHLCNLLADRRLPADSHRRMIKMISAFVREECQPCGHYTSTCQSIQSEKFKTRFLM